MSKIILDAACLVFHHREDGTELFFEYNLK